jgi:hypothetical protein
MQPDSRAVRGRRIWIADAHRGDGKRFVVHAEEKLTAFIELELAAPSRPKIDMEALAASAYIRSQCRPK